MYHETKRKVFHDRNIVAPFIFRHSTGCMYAIAADNGEMKPYDLNGQKSSSESDGGKAPGHILEDAPAPQDLLKEKFKSMMRLVKTVKALLLFRGLSQQVLQSTMKKRLFTLSQQKRYTSSFRIPFGSMKSMTRWCLPVLHLFRL